MTVSLRLKRSFKETELKQRHSRLDCLSSAGASGQGVLTGHTLRGSFEVLTERHGKLRQLHSTEQTTKPCEGHSKLIENSPPRAGAALPFFTALGVRPRAWHVLSKLALPPSSILSWVRSHLKAAWMEEALVLPCPASATTPAALLSQSSNGSDPATLHSLSVWGPISPYN